MAQNSWDFPLIEGDNIFNMRVPLNNALDNIVTNHAGTTAPATVHDRMWFYNKTTNVMQLEDGAGGFINMLKGEADGGMVSKAAPVLQANINMGTFKLFNTGAAVDAGAVPTNSTHRLEVRDAAGTGVLGYLAIYADW